jgi:hypothetical protein
MSPNRNGDASGRATEGAVTNLNDLNEPPRSSPAHSPQPFYIKSSLSKKQKGRRPRTASKSRTAAACPTFARKPPPKPEG